MYLSIVQQSFEERSSFWAGVEQLCGVWHKPRLYARLSEDLPHLEVEAGAALCVPGLPVQADDGLHLIPSYIILVTIISFITIS